MKGRKMLMFVILIMTSVPNLAQEDDQSWWKKLFKKESVEEIEKEEKEEKTDEIENQKTLDIDTIETEKIAPDSSMFKWGPLSKSEVEGKISVHNDFPIDSLKTTYQGKTQYGYRIQIFFGELNAAKSTRATFMSNRNADKCYIELRAPDYAVLVGDYRDLFEAHQRLFILRDTYPRAMIIESEIEI